MTNKWGCAEIVPIIVLSTDVGVQSQTLRASTYLLFIYLFIRQRSNSIPWCTSFHVILSLCTWHIVTSNLHNARNEHRSAWCGWFRNMSVQQLRAFEIIELAYIHCALKENSALLWLRRVLHGFQWSVENYLCARSQLQTQSMRLGNW